VANIGKELFYSLFVELIVVVVAIIVRDDKRKIAFVLFVGTALAGIIGYGSQIFSQMSNIDFVTPTSQSINQVIVNTATEIPSCISSDNVDTIKFVDSIPSPSTSLEIGKEYRFTIKVQYQLSTRNNASLAVALCNIDKDNISNCTYNDLNVEIKKGCDTIDLVWSEKVIETGQTGIDFFLMMNLDQGAYTYTEFSPVFNVIR